VQVSFRSYWTRVLLEALRNVKGDISIKEISDATMIRGQDIVDTLQVCVGGLSSVKFFYSFITSVIELFIGGVKMSWMTCRFTLEGLLFQLHCLISYRQHSL
jgi:hypothetical protein